MSKKDYITGTIMLIMTAFLWGTTFIIQSDAMNTIGPFTFSALRSVIGSISLFIFYFITRRGKLSEHFRKESMIMTLKGGLSCGIVLFAATNLQNIGMIGASAGKAAFITALYILIVPVLGLFLGKRPAPVIWLCVFISVIGFYLLNLNPDEGFGLTVWEAVIFLSAIAFSFHILACEKYADKVDYILLSGIQFAVIAVLSIACIFVDISVFGYPFINSVTLKNEWFNILYGGLFSSGIAFTLQIAGQKKVPASAAVLIMSLESIFAAALSWIISPEENALSPIQLAGCALIFASICISQIPFGNIRKTKPG